MKKNSTYKLEAITPETLIVGIDIARGNTRGRRFCCAVTNRPTN